MAREMLSKVIVRRHRKLRFFELESSLSLPMASRGAFGHSLALALPDEENA